MLLRLEWLLQKSRETNFEGDKFRCLNPPLLNVDLLRYYDTKTSLYEFYIAVS